VTLDTLFATSADLAGDPAVIARAEAVRSAVAAASGEIESTRRLPPALLDKLHEAGLFRLLLPRSSNGIETDPLTFFHVIETIARADASTAWCLSQAGGCAMSAAYLDLPVARAIFGDDPRAVLAWGPGPKVRAIECDGGYRISGVWAFASGGRHATWLGAHCPIYQTDGSPKLDAGGVQQESAALRKNQAVQNAEHRIKRIRVSILPHAASSGARVPAGVEVSALDEPVVTVAADPDVVIGSRPRAGEIKLKLKLGTRRTQEPVIALTQQIEKALVAGGQGNRDPSDLDTRDSSGRSHHQASISAELISAAASES